MADAQTRIANGEPAMAVLRELSASNSAQEVAQILKLVWQFGCPTDELLILLACHNDFAQSQRAAVSAASAKAKFTVRIIFTMPWVTLLICQWAGLKSLDALTKNWLGWLVLFISASMIWLSRNNVKNVIARNMVVEPDSGLEFDLQAAALRSGVNSRLSYLQLKSLSAQSRAESMLRQQIRLAKLPDKLMLNSGLLMLPATILLSIAPVVIASFLGFAS